MCAKLRNGKQLQIILGTNTVGKDEGKTKWVTNQEIFVQTYGSSLYIICAKAYRVWESTVWINDKE
jgi:hypothetical protein